MKRHFVLDENIIILAQEQRNDRGERDSTCLDLLTRIADNCHSFVLTSAAWAMYAAQIKRLQLQGIPLTPRVLAIVRSMLADATKDTRYADNELPDIPDLAGLPGVDKGDALFVRIAASLPGSILVTTDGPLTRAIAQHGLDQHFGFVFRSPAEALNDAAEE
jgi:hypothetical protein